MKTMSASGWTKHMGSPLCVRIVAAKGRKAAHAASLDTGRLGVTEDLTRATALVHCNSSKIHIRRTFIDHCDDVTSSHAERQVAYVFSHLPKQGPSP